MNRKIPLLVAVLFLFGHAAYAQQIIQGRTSEGDVITTNPAYPNNSIITTPRGQAVHSTLTLSDTGKKIEMDSDDSVFVVFPDGARVSAPNGITTLINGETVTVRDGKRIP